MAAKGQPAPYVSPYDIPVGYAHPHQQFAAQPQYEPFSPGQNQGQNPANESATSPVSQSTAQDSQEESVPEQIYVEGVQLSVPAQEEPEPQDVPKPIFEANPNQNPYMMQNPNNVSHQQYGVPPTAQMQQ